MDDALKIFVIIEAHKNANEQLKDYSQQKLSNKNIR